MHQVLAQYNAHAVLIPVWDMWRSEFVQPADNLLRHITGFTGSYAIAVITPEGTNLFVDGRYTLQASQESPSAIIQDIATFRTWMTKHMTKCRVVFDPWLWSVKALSFDNIDFHPVPFLIDKVWPDHPERAYYDIEDYPNAGLSTHEKIEMLNLEHPLLIHSGESLSWLTNKRSFKKPYNPSIEQMAILDTNGDLKTFCPSDISVPMYLQEHPCMQVSPEAPLALTSKIKEPIYKDDPIEPLKAMRHPKEIDAIRETHVKDGAALTEYLHWLDTQKGTITEVTAQDKLLTFRQKQEGFIGESFATISGAREHGAIIHYRATPESCFTLKSGDLYLVDSGGQYYGGTTDVTRTVVYQKQEVDPEIKSLFTRVLKGYLAVAYTPFPKGTTGSHLDALARQFLWEEGLDYQHGTGHGVGHCLGVHEGPQGISRRLSKVILKPGMIVSIEPGYYRDHAFGMRHEDLALVIERGDGWLAFEILTIAPIDTRLLDMSLLTPRELRLIGQYQQRVYDTLKHRISCNAWLQKHI